MSVVQSISIPFLTFQPVSCLTRLVEKLFPKDEQIQEGRQLLAKVSKFFFQ